MRGCLWFGLLLWLVAPMTVWFVPAFAQAATPRVLALPVTPDPLECSVALPSIAAVQAKLRATPAPGTPLASMMASPDAFRLPKGTPADAKTVGAITQAVRETVACINANNILTIFALSTDQFIQRVQAQSPLTDADLAQMAASPEALEPNDYASLLAVHDVTILSDGRVGALAELSLPRSSAHTEVDFFVFRHVKGRWLIDDLVQHLEDQYPPTVDAMPTSMKGTPTT